MKCYSEQIADLALKKSRLETCKTLPVISQAWIVRCRQILEIASRWIFQMMICHFREKKE